MRALIVVENDDKGIVTENKFYIIGGDKEQVIKCKENLSEKLQETIVNYIKSSNKKIKGEFKNGGNET